MDVVDLREFYTTPLGMAARRLVARRLHARWPSIKNMRLLGIGYANPYLESFQTEASHCISFMPARLGALSWPDEGPNKTVLVDEAQLPLPDSSIDFALIIHALELTQEPTGLLNEVFRILAPQGRALFVLPNRRGLWARFDSTPFGHGQPYSKSQLNLLLRDAQFSTMGWSDCLFMPPVDRKICIRSSLLLERAGLTLGAGFSGLIMAEVVKQVYALPPGKRARRLIPQLRPVLQPTPALLKP
jgi:SAM-dependent methyltransferase